MNCYVCRVETGCESHPALAICQRCGAGICGLHLVELTVTPVVGLAGDRRSILVCCRCSQTQLYQQKVVKEQEKQGKTSGCRWWQRFRRSRPSALPTPEEAVAAVEQFLNGKPDE
jgi:hypothetical protein